MSPRLVSVQIGVSRQFIDDDDHNRSWTSGIIKCPVANSVSIHREGIEGDVQVDRENHGGPDKAILGYSATHYPMWNSEFPAIEFSFGGFGENLTLDGIDESSCCIGDVMQIGDCELEISQPRQPCWKLSRRWKLPSLSVTVQSNGRTGWYYRVLKCGSIQQNMPVTLLHRPHPELTIAWANSVMYAKQKAASDDRRLAGCPQLSDAWRTVLTNRLRRN